MGSTYTMFDISYIQTILDNARIAEERLVTFPDGTTKTICRYSSPSHRKGSHIGQSILLIHSLSKQHGLKCYLCARESTSVIYTPNNGFRFIIDTTRYLTIDHIVARKDGGSDDFSNLAICCNICNVLKDTNDKTYNINDLFSKLDVKYGYKYTTILESTKIELALLLPSYPFVYRDYFTKTILPRIKHKIKESKHAKHN